MSVAIALYRVEITGTDVHKQGLIEATAASTLSCSRRIASSLSSRNIDEENDEDNESDVEEEKEEEDEDDDDDVTAGMKEEDA